MIPSRDLVDRVFEAVRKIYKINYNWIGEFRDELVDVEVTSDEIHVKHCSLHLLLFKFVLYSYMMVSNRNNDDDKLNWFEIYKNIQVIVNSAPTKLEKDEIVYDLLDTYKFDEYIVKQSSLPIDCDINSAHEKVKKIIGNDGIICQLLHIGIDYFMPMTQSYEFFIALKTPKQNCESSAKNKKRRLQRSHRANAKRSLSVNELLLLSSEETNVNESSSDNEEEEVQETHICAFEGRLYFNTR